MDVFRRIETGEECRRHAPALLRLVEGAGAAADLVSLRPHLRHCTACRATVRDLHRSRLHRLALHLPLVAGVAPARWLGDRLSDAPARVPLERGADVPALLDRGAAAPSPRGAGGVWQQILARLHSSDLATGAQLASSGGGRGAAVATILGLCLGAGGAGTYCLSTGGLPDPERLLGARGARPRGGRPRRSGAPTPRAGSAPVTVAAASVRELKPAVATATPTPAPAPPRRARVQRRVTARRTPAPPAREPQQQEFSFENRAAAPPAPVAVAASAGAAPAARAPSATPAPPASGGGEFLP